MVGGTVRYMSSFERKGIRYGTVLIALQTIKKCVPPSYGTVELHISQIGQSVVGGYGTVELHISQIGKSVVGGTVRSNCTFSKSAKVWWGVRYGRIAHFRKRLKSAKLCPPPYGQLSPTPTRGHKNTSDVPVHALQ